ncbi:M48 family metallopeptidase [Micrococcales bacterium 31B]|nr:M48 family metallopeptidase [Micrococcales bacterium 31B]
MTDSAYDWEPAARRGLTVVLRRSARRKRTLSSRLHGDRIIVSVPAAFNERSQRDLLHRLLHRTLRRRASESLGDAELLQRSVVVARAHLDSVPQPASVRWVTNQGSRWGSCTPDTGQIRISHRLQRVPSWVLDAVLFHEMIHLVIPGHGPEFRALERRYPRLDEANTFLSGYALGLGLADGGPGADGAGDLPH